MIDTDTIDWAKMDGLVPAIVQDAATRAVLMLGYMDRAALAATLSSGKATFFSRSKQRLWQKGETSGNVLEVVDIRADCDSDALLVMARPVGPTCHLGTTTCFDGDQSSGGFALPGSMEAIVADRAKADPADSYTARLMASGIKRIAQKVGEEGLETALAAATGDRDECIDEAADLVYHLTVLLHAMDLGWADIERRLERRHHAGNGAAGEN